MAKLSRICECLSCLRILDVVVHNNYEYFHAEQVTRSSYHSHAHVFTYLDMYFQLLHKMGIFYDMYAVKAMSIGTQGVG